MNNISLPITQSDSSFLAISAPSLASGSSATQIPIALTFVTNKIPFNVASSSLRANDIAEYFTKSELVKIDVDQAWYWTPGWQFQEKEADEDFRVGRYQEFDTMENFVSSLLNPNPPDDLPA